MGPRSAICLGFGQVLQGHVVLAADEVVQRGGQQTTGKVLQIDPEARRPLTAAATFGRSRDGCGSGFARIARTSPTRASVR